MEGEHKRTLTMYKCIKYGFEHVLEDMVPDGYIAVSHPVEVTFTPLDKGDVINSEISALKEGIKEVKGQAAETVRGLEDKIQTLLALPNLSGK
ncbi:MAG: hypothetical protein ACTSV7_00610 [Candidatus Baldrarchaeia archaeon]